MFFTSIRKQVGAARKDLRERLQNIRDLLSQPGLDDSLRVELEAKEAKIKAHFETRIKKINGGP